jgi:hypothetical protein
MLIRYQHARNLAIGGGVLFIGLAVFGCCFWGGLTDDDPKPARALQTSSPKTSSPKTSSPSASKASGDARIIELAQRTATPNSKEKDALGQGHPKVNLYEDNGDNHYDRLKVDRDRDDSWDESWNYKEGRWEKDGGALVWDGGAWASPKKSTGVSATPAKSGDAEFADVAHKILHERASDKKIKDLHDGSGPKINLYDDDGDGKWDRAKVDRDRDDTWDESWTAKDGTVERKLAPNDKILYFKDGAWADKP